PEDVRKFFRALKRAQRDLDLRPELYTHFYKNEFPTRYHARMDTRRWGPGERIVFEPYSQDIFEESRDWIRERGIFEGNDLGAKSYDSAVVRLAVLSRPRSFPRKRESNSFFAWPWVPAFAGTSGSRAFDLQPDQPVQGRRIIEQFARWRAVYDRAALHHHGVLRQRQH